MLNPSRTEAFGNVTLEAMACGLVLVSSDVPSARGLIENGTTGFLVAPGSGAAYARKLAQILDDPLLRGRVGRAAAEAAARHDWSSSLAAVVAAYRRIGAIPGQAPDSAPGPTAKAPGLAA